MIKKLAILGGSLGALLTAGTTFAATPILTIATSTPTDLLAYAGQLFTDTWLIIAVAVGIPLAFYIIRKVIGLVPKGR